MDTNTNRKVGSNLATEKPQGELVGSLHLDVEASQEKQPDTTTEKLFDLIEGFDENNPSTDGMYFTGRLANGTENVSKVHTESGRAYQAISPLGMRVSGWLRKSTRGGKKKISLRLTHFETAEGAENRALKTENSDQKEQLTAKDAELAAKDKRIAALEAAAAAK